MAYQKKNRAISHESANPEQYDRDKGLTFKASYDSSVAIAPAK